MAIQCEACKTTTAMPALITHDNTHWNKVEFLQPGIHNKTATPTDQFDDSTPEIDEPELLPDTIHQLNQ